MTEYRIYLRQVEHLNGLVVGRRPGHQASHLGEWKESDLAGSWKVSEVRSAQYKR